VEIIHSSIHYVVCQQLSRLSHFSGFLGETLIDKDDTQIKQMRLLSFNLSLFYSRKVF